MFGIDGINYLAFGPYTFVEGEIFGFCFLAFLPFHSKIAIDGEEHEELSEDKRYEGKIQRQHNILL